MKKQQIRIRCVYQNTEKTIGDLLMESFRLYLRRVLQNDRDISQL